MIAVFYSGCLPLQEHSLIGEHCCDSDDSYDHDRRVGLQLQDSEDAKHERIKNNGCDQYAAIRIDLAAQAAKYAPIDQDIHHKVKDGAERRDTAEIEEHR